jgi:hypothetical protein
MSREINEHRVMGAAIVVDATDEQDARKQIAAMPYSKRRDRIWEIKELSPGKWECYVAMHEDCFALND